MRPLDSRTAATRPLTPRTTVAPRRPRAALVATAAAVTVVVIIVIVIASSGGGSGTASAPRPAPAHAAVSDQIHALQQIVDGATRR